jgi:hypothetical protein
MHLTVFTIARTSGRLHCEFVRPSILGRKLNFTIQAGAVFPETPIQAGAVFPETRNPTNRKDKEKAQ